MTPSDRARFAGVMARYSEHYREPLSEIAMSDYFCALEHVSIEALEQTVPLVLREHRWYPRAAELSDYAEEWDKHHAMLRASARAQSHGLPEAATMSPEQQHEIFLSAMREIRTILAGTPLGAGRT